MMRPVFLALLLPALITSPVLAQAFKLAPAVAIEAEDFTVESGWKVVKNGAGNYMVDIIGFNHISGERLLSLPGASTTGRAYHDVTIPGAGKYRLWVRYEYPAFCETRFKVILEQDGKRVLEHVMGTIKSPRQAFGEPGLKAQHDPSWGPEGVMEEPVNTPELKAGPARIILEGVAQPQTVGVAANRNLDLIYLTSDLDDGWRKHYQRTTGLYPILDAFRDTRGPRWQVRFTNRGSKSADFRITHTYNRLPWGYTDPAGARGIEPGKATDWIGLLGQDTTHFSMIQFFGSGGEFEIELRPVGGAVVRKLAGGSPLQIYVPPYPGKGELPRTPEEAIDAILADLEKHPAPGKKPTQPLCYGGWMPLGQDNAYGRKYASLYAALGFRSLHPAHSGNRVLENLAGVGIQPTKSWMVMGYRNPPTRENITRGLASLASKKLTDFVRFFDYGDEIHFSEWLGMLIQEELLAARAAGVKTSAQEILVRHWLEWLKANRSDRQLKDYWLETWGPIRPGGFRPDSSEEAARLNPRLYIDSLLFYEDTAIAFAASGAKAVRAAMGKDVLCGANYSCHPFYYPHSTMYIKWFRGGAADMGRQSEYFWQVAQPGPMINGYIAEHFRCGLRDTPTGTLRQYTMPHAPGNTDESFLRSVFSHLAHGATMLDFFGIGLNESFTENHIDHRAVSRFRALRDVTHCVGFVEDVLPSARPLPSRVALLISESSERWDHAGTATDQAGNAQFGKDFRKTRMHFHLERLGIWKALTFAGHSPDLLTEADVAAGKLKGYRLAVLVGDHWARDMVPAVERWVKDGGVVLATAASGQRDSYGEPRTDWHALAGLTKVTTKQHVTFMRPRQELPFLTPLDTVTLKDGISMPALATRERIEVSKDSKILAKFPSDESPALVERKHGKGTVLYVAAHPGLAFLWSALQPPLVPDRGPHTHTVPTRWDEGATQLSALALQRAEVGPGAITATGAGAIHLDARVLDGPGAYLVPIGNYSPKLGEKVRLVLRTPTEVVKVLSAYHGELKADKVEGGIAVTVPALGAGDVLRLEKKKK